MKQRREARLNVLVPYRTFQNGRDARHEFTDASGASFAAGIKPGIFNVHEYTNGATPFRW
jgi:hypothetical protein